VPILGTGILPPSGAIATELTSVVRRAFVPKVFVQIYQSSPLMLAFLANNNMATGGVSPITVPVQGTQMTTGQWIGYDGSFNLPGTIPGIQNAEFNLKGYITPIPFLGMEGLVQVDYSVVPLIEARMNDAAEQTIKSFTTALYGNISNTSQIIGLPGAIDDGTNASSYGGIARSTTNAQGTAWWKSYYVSNAGTGLSRDLVLTYVAAVTKKTGESPNIGVCGFGTWTTLAKDFTSNERYNYTPSNTYSDGKISAHFRAIEVAGVPVYPDPYCPEGTLYLLNTNYINLYIHERAAFQVLPFESTFANGQLGYVGGLLNVMELVNVKPQAHGAINGLSYTSL
jgi:hypothetical protein